MASQETIEFFGLTDVGVRRSHNQDSFALLPATEKDQWQSRGHVFVVSDGMGAHAVGELASKMAADAIPHIYSKHAHEGPPAALRRAFIEANSTIHTRGQQNREFEGMGTTSTALVLRPEGAWVGHVGDSRAYRIRGDKLEQISFDHSLVWEMARRQKCNPEDLEGIPSNVIVRSLGPEPLVQVDVEGPHPIRAGDTFVLCSDGLSGPVSDQEIAAVATVLPPKDACRLLIDLANLHGGPDNITAIVVKVKNFPESSAEEHSGTWQFELPPKPKAWHEKFPWPMLALGFGILLAVAAIFFTMNQMSALAIGAFLLAAIALIGGLAGVFLQYKQDSQVQEQIPLPPPKIHRQSTFPIDRPLIEKLTKAQTTLEERLREHGWEADWEPFRAHQQKVEEYLEKEELTDAFRETCLALRILTEAIQKQSTKEEVFQPLWETRAPRHV